MKITISKVGRQPVRLRTLARGTRFGWGGRHFMLLDTLEYDAADLSNGAIVHFSSEDVVASEEDPPPEPTYTLTLDNLTRDQLRVVRELFGSIKGSEDPGTVREFTSAVYRAIEQHVPWDSKTHSFLCGSMNQVRGLYP